MTTRRDFLGYGIGSFLLLGCGGRGQASTPRDALAPTPQIDDDDAPPPEAFGAVCAVTADNIEGPFYKPGAPHRAVLAGPDADGERLVLGGTVRTTSCEPLANATLDIWHANARGDYDNEGFGFRGRITTDKLGRW